VATILVVDDEADIRLFVRFTLTSDGHEVIEAADGVEALEVVARHRPDLIVLDVMMPELSGWDTLAELKANPDPRVQEIPVVMLTALSAAMDRAKGGIEGAVRYLAKPIGTDDLISTINTALHGEPEPVQRKRAQREALESIARHERGDESGEPPSGASSVPRPRLSALEPARSARPAPPAGPPDLAPLVATLTDKQRQLLEGVRAAPTVMEAADGLGMSRSNVYASLRRIARRLGVRSVSELLDLVRAGHVVG
jgi:CheY-like chemotaxis protein